MSEGNIYPLTEKRQKYFIYFCGLVGAAALIGCIYEILTENTGVIVDGKIVSSALGAIYGLMLILANTICREKPSSTDK